MRTHRARRGERGAAVVEFALVFPLVMLFVFGIIQYGYHFWAMQTASATAREAARRLIVYTDPVCTVADAKSFAEGPNIGSPPTVDIQYDNSANEPRRGSLVTVTVTIHSLDLGILPVPNDGVVVQKATSRVENTADETLDCTTP
jgi:hypothetical protein